MSFKYNALALITASLLVTACGSSSSSSDNGNTTEDGEQEITSNYETVELDATDGSTAVQLDLASGAIVTDDSWHLAYQKYLGFKLNGGSSGDAGVSGCIAHEYSSIFDSTGASIEDEFKLLTVSSTEDSFVAVTADSCTDFVEDSVATFIETEEWLDADYSAGAPVYGAKAGNGWIIRSADGATYGRVSVNSVEVVFGASTTRKLVFNSELWNGSVFETAQLSPELDFSEDQVYWDLETNSLVSATDDWELSVSVNGRDYPLQINGGASGTGQAGVGAVLSDDLASVTDPTDTAQVYKYFADTASGVLSGPGTYGPLQYAVAGGHLMWPTFTTYLIKDAQDRLFKVQVVSNYGANGNSASGNLVLRYEELN
ncbi:hypothetical protein E2R68_10780 [Psychromonas sp. RZ22]|uniref:HmuY family protein n=1 Tax=Psychromonas algarum TaxID=2555643 RepID=UPI001068758D|nr:HmuY family protein [Psychromonas sp. RZ22]TEW53961.1 hypothetical protein E2R68_10780 [Psychromonas sp. RZ22]